MNVGGFSEHQNKTSDTDRYKGYFLTPRFFQVNVNTMKKNFEQRSEMKVAKCLIVHVLCSSYHVSTLELGNRRKAAQKWNLHVTNDFVLNELRVYHERVYADNVVSKFWFVGSFTSQHCSKFIANNTSDKMSQICTKKCKTRSIICTVNLNTLSSSRHFNCNKYFAVIVSFLNESVHGFNKIRNGRLTIRFQIIQF